MAENGKRTEVRILLVGDRHVGKTSLILSLVSEEFPLDVPSKAEEITIPGDLTPEKVPTCIVDYSAMDQTDAVLEAELRRSHVVCIVYAVDDEDTLDSVTDHWLPFIRRTLAAEKGKGEDGGNGARSTLAHTTPVILVGNKVDLVDYSTMQSVLPIMNEYEEIETCVECSARNLKNISEMFYFAQKAVLHPSAPLWNYHQKDLTDKCKKALTRVFRICDADNDSLLSDQELANFQRKCFGMDLESGTLESLKAVVEKNCSEGIVLMTSHNRRRNSHSNDDRGGGGGGGLTVKGFLTLHGLFIQRGRHETTWTILRKFGYDDDLSFRKSYLSPSGLKIPPGSTAELSWAGYEFLTRIFEKHDVDRDGCLNPQELISLFSGVCPLMPWGQDIYNTVPVQPRTGWLGLPGYLGLWTLTTLLDTNKTLEYLAYLGYTFNNSHEDTQLGAINVTRDKKIDIARKQTARNVYRCHVIGPRDSGKTTFCQGLLGRSREDVIGILEEDLPRHTINTVQVYGQDKYLVLQDVDVKSISDSLISMTSSESVPMTSSSSSALNCDVVCLIYDASNPRSFEFVAKIYLRYFSSESKIPVLMVANKSDRLPGNVRQEYLLQPEAFCAKHRLPPPQPFSTLRSKVKRDIYVKLATMAAFPNLRRLVHAMILKQPPREWIGTFRHFRQLGLLASDAGSYFKYSLGLALAAFGGIFLIRMLRTAQT